MPMIVAGLPPAPFIARVTWLMADCAMFGWPPDTLFESGWRGVLAPVLVDDDGGTRLPGESRSRLGIEWSMGIEPSV
jgi:hypothetical protein